MIGTTIPSRRSPFMKRILMSVMAVAVAVTFSAPAFAGDKPKEEKKGGKFVEMIYAEEGKKKDSGKADETFAEEKKKPAPGK
jgi:hypothetical protein